VKNVPDDLLREARGRNNELPRASPGRWGKVERLATGTQVVAGKPQQILSFVQTGIIADQPTPIAIKIRFSLDGLTYTPEVPSTFGGNVIVKLIETIDMKTGAFLESFTLAPGDAQSFCSIMAMGLDLSVALDGEDIALFVEVVAAPTTMVDCNDIVPPPPTTTTPAIIQPNTQRARYDAVTANTYNIPVTAKRGYFLITNMSAANLFVSLGGDVDITPGSELATIVLPPGAFAGYEALNYMGSITFRFDADDASGYALTTEGFYA